MTGHTKRHFQNLLKAYIVCLCLSCMLSQAYAQDADTSDENLSGNAWFDFAFQDEKNIIQRGTAGAKPRTELAQAEDESDEEAEEDDQDNPDIGTGLSGVQPVAEARAMPVSNVLGNDESIRIADLELECIELDFCHDKNNVDALLRATGLELGHLTTASDLALSIERLRKTGYFSNIHQRILRSGDRISVVFETVPQTTIRKIIVDESGSLYESEVKKRMILRPGGALYPRTAILRGMDVDEIPKDKLIQMALEDQEKSLTRIYTKEGYLDTEVKITTEEVGPNLVDLHVRAENAKRYVLGKIYVYGHHVKTYSEIESVFRSEFSMFGSATKAEIEDAVDAVLQDYHKDGYYQTKIDFVSRRVSDKKTIDVFLKITESDRWEIQFSGNSALSEKELMSVLTFSDSGFVDGAEVSASVTALEQLYVSAGYYKAKVSGELVRATSQRRRERARRNAPEQEIANTQPELERDLKIQAPPNVVIFTIEEGSRYEIGEIKFDGLEGISRETLLDAISSREYSTFGSGAYPQRAMIAGDAATIIEIFREHGYLNADVPSWILKPMENGRLCLEFHIEAHEQSHFSHRQIRYTDRETYDQFDVTIEPPNDDIFSDSTFRAERASITKQLRARGHATISDRVHCTSYNSDGSVASEETCDIAEFKSACLPDEEAVCEIIETREGPAERCYRHYKTENNDPNAPKCKPTNGITGSIVDVEYEVTLGPKFSFGDIFVHGNVVTRDYVVQQDIPFQYGETFDINKVIDARSLLRRRTIYKSATMNVIGVDDDLATQSELGDSTSTAERSVPVVINLEEGERRWFDFALGIQLTGGDWIGTGEVEYVEANLAGTGLDLRVLLMPEFRIATNYTDLVFTQKFNQNFFFLTTLSIPILPASGLNVITQLFYDLRYIPETNKEEYGVLAELQWEASKSWFTALAIEVESSKTSSFGIDVSDNIKEYHACYPFTFFMDCPFPSESALTFSITPRFSYDGRDNPLTPKYGFYAEGKLKLGYSSAIGVYAKPEARLSYMYTFLKYFTAAFNMRFGVSFLKKGQKLPYIDRYFLGGLNMRGYDNEALGPRLVNDLTPNVATNEAGGGEVLFNLTAELRYPIWESVGIYGALFVDMGALTRYQPMHYSAGEFGRELFINQMRYTAGLGLRWQISEAIPPIVIDYGFILNRRRGDPLGGFSLNVGYTF